MVAILIFLVFWASARAVGFPQGWVALWLCTYVLVYVIASSRRDRNSR